jgi:hypothetical protein
MVARGGSLIEQLWLGELRRAARRATGPVPQQIGLGCGAAAAATILTSALPLHSSGAAAQATWAAGWAAAGYVTIWTALLIGHLWRYRSSGFGDHDWLAGHDDSDPGGAVFLELGRRSAASPHLGADLKLYVKSHSTWQLVADQDVIVMPDKVIRCRFDLNHTVFPSGFYEVRWYQADNRGKLAEITRERFQLQNHSLGRRTGSTTRTNRKLAPKPLPTRQTHTKPRRAIQTR